MSTLTKFNINNKVAVRLTDYGRTCLRKNYDQLNAACGGRLMHPFKLPEETVDGWSEWQMHDLMNQLGEYVGPCFGDTPFEPEILVEL